MHLDVQAHNVVGGQPISIHLNKIPDICPLCHRSIHPKHISSYNLPDRKFIQTVFCCPHSRCQELFISTYQTIKHSGKQLEGNLQKSEPSNPVEAIFPDTIKGISPTFLTIYNQAMSAESYRLDQLVGIGLRKALEFLIKDFLVKQGPENESNIRSLMLGRCIKNYIDDPNLKKCAERATWLGNDETHYTRKWEDKDIEDLKILVQLTVNWIDSLLLTHQYEEDMTYLKPTDT